MSTTTTALPERPDLLREVSSMIYEAADEHGPTSAGALRRYVRNQYGPNAAEHVDHVLNRMVRRGAFAYDATTAHFVQIKWIAFGGKR